MLNTKHTPTTTKQPIHNTPPPPPHYTLSHSHVACLYGSEGCARRLLDAGMGRIAFENVWSYTCGFRPREDGLPEEADASPIFAPWEDPGDPAFFLPDVQAEVERENGC